MLILSVRWIITATMYMYMYVCVYVKSEVQGRQHADGI